MSYVNLFLFFLVCCASGLLVGLMAGGDVLRGRRFLRLLFVVAGGASCLFVGFALSLTLWLVSLQNYVNANLAKVRPILREQEFAQVSEEASPCGDVYLEGHVASTSARADLQREMGILFGLKQARRMVALVEVRENEPDRPRR